LSTAVRLPELVCHCRLPVAARRARPPHPPRHARSTRPSSTTDAQWRILETPATPPGTTRGSGWATGRNIPPPDPGRDRSTFVRGGNRLGATTPVTSAYQTVYGIFSRWAAAGAWQRVHDALREPGRVTPDATAPHRGDHRLANRARRRHRASGQRRLRRGQENQGPQTPHRHRHDGAAAGRRGHGRAHPRPRTARIDCWQHCASRFSTVSHVWADGGYAGRLLPWAQKVLSVTVEWSNGTDKLSGFLVLPGVGWSRRTFGWIIKHRRCVRDYETLPAHHEAMVNHA